MKYWVALVPVFALLLSACDVSLAGDVTPEPNAVISSQGTPEPISAPASDPDVVAGAALYTEYCAPCHGVSGLGEGEQAASLPFAPAPIGDGDLARTASPAEWYRMVSEGRLTRYMPPFASVLSPQQRWDVLAYVYSLSLDESDLQIGAGLHANYQAEIAQLLDGDALAAERDLIVPLGIGDVETTALTAYLQASALGIESELDPAIVSPSAEGELPAVSAFSGRVLYGSEGSMPAGLEVTLTAYDDTQQVLTETLTLGADGSFEFEGIPVAPERIFFVQVAYKGQIYFSEFINATGEQTEFGQPITIYETTTDLSQLAVEGVQFFLDFSKPEAVRVAQQVSISNVGDRAVVPLDDGQPVLHFSLPPQASSLAFQESEIGERYILDERGFGDLRGVLPGTSSYLLLFAYELPYNNGVDFIINIDLPTRVLTVYLPGGNIEMRSEDFQLVGEQNVGSAPYSVFVAQGAYLPGDEVQISLSGPHPIAGEGWSSLLQDQGLLAGLAAVTAVVGVTWLWVRSLPARHPEQLMDEILALDEKYELGRVGEASYQQRRAALKAQLRKALTKRSRS